MAIDKDNKIFDNTSFSDILKKINSNQEKKSNQINTLIDVLKPLIKKLADAQQVVPLIKEYLDISVKNDEQLIKLATVYQRYIAAENRVFESGDNSILTDEEKQDLLQLNRDSLTKNIMDSEEMVEDAKDIDKKMKDLNNELNEITENS